MATVATTIPVTLTPGTYYLWAIADALNTQAESNESNNTRVHASTLAITHHIDLVMSAVSSTATSVAKGGTVVVTNTEKNQGSAAMTATSNRVDFYLSADANITASDVKITGSRTISGALAAGASSASEATTVTIPANVAAGKYYIGALADAGNAQAENLETNNGTASATRLTVPKGSGKEIYYIHADHLNTPRLLTNTSGITVWRWDNSDPFGNNTALEDPDADGQKVVFNLRFPGQYFDKETGQHYNYYRDYNPSTGRYVQSDPIGLGGGLNTFGYVRNRPLSNIDPEGLLDVPFFIPDSKVVDFARKKSAEFKIDLSRCSDKEILDFVDFVPEEVAKEFQEAYDARPSTPKNGKKLTKEEERINRVEYERGKKILDDQMKKWREKRKKQGKSTCDCG